MNSVVFLKRAALALLLAAVPQISSAQENLQPFVEQTLLTARGKAHLPAIAALVQIDGKVAAEVALGVRAEGQPDAVTKADRWHIGSDTKAVTATLIARLVEQKRMSFDETLAASLPGFVVDPAYRNLTVVELLSHTAGLAPMTDDSELPALMEVIKGVQGVTAQRTAIARKYLAMPPASKPGEFAYSNLGFVIAGAIAEARTGKAWEDLIREEIFAPLGIQDAGFGAPGQPGKIDQPRGHGEKSGKFAALEPAISDANTPPVIGPAGTISISLRDWMLFAQDHLDGEHGHGKLLTPAGYRKLHTPVFVAGDNGYAFGWSLKMSGGVPLALGHAGSNGYWLAEIRIMPKRDIIYAVVTNAGNEAAGEAVQDVNAALMSRLKPFE